MNSFSNYAVILDRDKTINEDPGYINDSAKVKLMPQATEGLRLLNAFSIPLFVATNQSGVSRGLIQPAELAAVNRRIAELLAEGGAHVAGFYVCPHADSDNCQCRKPRSGLIDQIRSEHSLDPQRTFLVGDRARDLTCGEHLGMRGILIGDEERVEPANCIFRAKNLHEAASFILETIFEDFFRAKFFASIEGLLPHLKQMKADGKKLVFTNGCFDILHSGHVQLLAQARALGDFLVLGLNSDRSVRALKGEKRPVNTALDRARVLAQLPSVDAVVVFDEDTPVELLRRIGPMVHVKGGDYIKENLPEFQTVAQGGGDVVILPFRKGYSTTAILAR